MQLEVVCGRLQKHLEKEAKKDKPNSVAHLKTNAVHAFKSKSLKVVDSHIWWGLEAI